MTTLRHAGLTPAATGAPLKGTGAWFRAGLDWLRAARARRGQSLELAAMSDHELSDLGVGRSEVPALLAREPVQDRALWIRGVV